VVSSSNNGKPDKLVVSISYTEDESDSYDRTNIRVQNPDEDEIHISVSRGKNQDPIKTFENRLIQEYPVKLSMKDKVVVNRFTEAHKNGEKSTFKSLFKMFDRK
jgi:hypothetical protein